MKKIICYISMLLLACNLCAEPSCYVQVYAQASNAATIYEYYDSLSNGQYEEALNLLGGDYYNDVFGLMQNEYNKENRIGLFNIKKANVISATKITNPGQLGIEYNTFENAQSVYQVNINFEVYSEDEYIKNGINKRYVILDGNDKILGCTSVSDEGNTNILNSGIAMLLSCDTPKAGITKNPSSIKVHRKSSNKIETVNFKRYCKVVTTCEVGYDWNQNALNACALAIKNYGVARVNTKKYPDLGYDVKDTEADQVYNPGKELQSKCNQAVDNIWYYFMYDSKGRLFPAFYVDNKTINSYAIKNGGMLSQKRSRDLANEGKSWKEIVRYFYNRVNGKKYYNSEVAVGNISVEYYYSK